MTAGLLRSITPKGNIAAVLVDGPLGGPTPMTGTYIEIPGFAVEAVRAPVPGTDDQVIYERTEFFIDGRRIYRYRARVVIGEPEVEQP
jgi:hypothetical protein